MIFLEYVGSRASLSADLFISGRAFCSAGDFFAAKGSCLLEDRDWHFNRFGSDGAVWRLLQ